MTDPDPDSDPPAPAPDESSKPGNPADKVAVQALVAACIEAIEQGESDPATRVCAERPDLLTRVQRRLAQLASRGLIPDSDALPAAIGPYRIVRELGSGGMGSVYLAEQLEPIRRHVALKVVKLGMDTREVVARFQAERQALALMNHPHIAQVFDAGITGAGRPYFVMEFVAGRSLTTFCDQQRLPMVQRVQLLATVCRAVQHAHERGFIHRDLKPSNVLVAEHDGAFVPKVIDFGIAKATAANDQTPTQPISLRTRADQVLGTPEYMSPEQMSSGGLDVDTRTDVYSLGVTLYELLCGELPFDSKRLRRATRHELERILLDELPTQPSKRLSQVGGPVLAARGGERTAVQRTVAGELDWITLKAIAKQREQRYPSALAMAEDLERWLAHEPVLAAPPGRTYRLRKFVRRHRVAVAAAAAVLVSLVTGLVVSVRATGAATRAQERTQEALVRAEAAQRATDAALTQTRTAEARTQRALTEAIAAQQREAAALADVRGFYDLARDAVDNLVDVASSELVEVPQADTVRRRLLADAIRFYEGLRAREPGDPSLRGDLVEATARIGHLQLQLGQSDDAVVSLERATTEAEALLTAAPAAPPTLGLALMTNNRFGMVLSSVGRDDDAKRHFQRALDVLQLMRTHDAGHIADADLQEARLCGNLAIESDRDPAAALAWFERAMAAYERIPTLSTAGEQDRARCTVGYAEALTRAGRSTDAATALADAARRLLALPADRRVAAREVEAQVHDKLANVQQRLGHHDEAAAAQRQATTIYERLAAEHPDVLAHADNAAAGWHFLAQIAEDEARLDDAQAAIDRAASMRQALAARAPQNHRFGMRYARTLLTKGGIELQRWQHDGGDRSAATATLTTARELVDRLQREHGDDIDVLTTYGGVHGALGQLAITEQRFLDAIAAYTAIRATMQAQLERFGTFPDVHYQLASAANGLLQAHLLAGDPTAAAAAGAAGLPHVERGLQLDARHRALRELAATLFARVAIARIDAGDLDSGVATLLTMTQRRELGGDCREQGCLLLVQTLARADDHAQVEAWRQQVVTELRAILAARGDVAAALKRPAQMVGFSHWRSRLRDLDLRLALAQVLGSRDERDEQARWLGEARQLADSLAELSADRCRNLTAQQAECALAQRDPATAVAVVAALVARVGDRGGANYLAACLWNQARAQVQDEAERERLALAIVARLQLAIAQQEVPANAVQHVDFDWLVGRKEFDALRR